VSSACKALRKPLVALQSARLLSSTGGAGPGGVGNSGFFKKHLSKAIVVCGLVGFATPFIAREMKGGSNGNTAQKIDEDREEAPLQSAVTTRVFFDVQIGDEPARRMVFGLYGKDCPRTVENFVRLCAGDRGRAKNYNVALHYKGSPFHRIIPGFMIQGGDFTRGDGMGGESIYGAKFDDESFRLKHIGVGVLSMANSGPNSNGSQFFVCVNPTPWLDERHVVFGQLTHGTDVLFDIEKCGSKKGTPSKRVTIVDCGVLPNNPLANEANPNEVELDETGRHLTRKFK
jgi:cyclophilin family peptidyl-prolyl cis-trans isomerase